MSVYASWYQGCVIASNTPSGTCKTARSTLLAALWRSISYDTFDPKEVSLSFRHRPDLEEASAPVRPISFLEV